MRATHGAHNAPLDREELESETLESFRKRYEALARSTRKQLDRGVEDTGTPEAWRWRAFRRRLAEGPGTLRDDTDALSAVRIPESATAASGLPALVIPSASRARSARLPYSGGIEIWKIAPPSSGERSTVSMPR